MILFEISDLQFYEFLQFGEQNNIAWDISDSLAYCFMFCEYLNQRCITLQTVKNFLIERSNTGCLVSHNCGPTSLRQLCQHTVAPQPTNNLLM